MILVWMIPGAVMVSFVWRDLNRRLQLPHWPDREPLSSELVHVVVAPLAIAVLMIAWPVVLVRRTAVVNWLSSRNHLWWPGPTPIRRDDPTA